MRKEFSFLALSLAAVSFVPAVAQATITNNTSLASPSTTPTDPGFYNGSGNSNTNFTVFTGNGIELGLRAILRNVGPIVPTPSNSSTYLVPLGFSSGTRAKWNFDFSFDGRPNGIGTLTLNDVVLQLTLTDVALGTTLSADPQDILDNAGWGPTGENVAAANLATDWGTQNSENLDFADIRAALDPGFDPNRDDTYIVTLSARLASCTLGDCTLGSVTETIIAGAGAPVPEPVSIALFGVGIAAVGFARRKRAG